jgi:hypothetical protein
MGGQAIGYIVANVVQVGVLATPPHVFLILLHICIVENTISKWKGYKENILV